MSENVKLKNLKEKLFAQPKNVFSSEYDISSADDFCEKYKDFLNTGKTERLCVKEAVRLAEQFGFVPFERGMKLSSGDKIYRNNRGKSIILAVIGKDGIESGANIAAAHIDSPRIDLKQSPVYESDGFCLFKTHYYGGIKKYQWPAIPLELQGVVVLKNGETVEVSIGGDPADPIFVITDLLPHLGKDQLKKNRRGNIHGRKPQHTLRQPPRGRSRSRRAGRG